MNIRYKFHFPCISLYIFFEKFLKFFFWNCLIFFLSWTTMLKSFFSVKASQKPFPKKFLKNFLKLSDPPPSRWKLGILGPENRQTRISRPEIRPGWPKIKNPSLTKFPPRSYLSENIYMLGSRNNRWAGKIQFVRHGQNIAKGGF